MFTHAHAPDLLGAMFMASGILMLWVAGVRNMHHPVVRRPGALNLTRLHAVRQVLLSLCGLTLVAIGSMLVSSSPHIQPTGCYVGAAPADALVPRCYHGAARRIAP